MKALDNFENFVTDTNLNKLVIYRKKNCYNSIIYGKILAIIYGNGCYANPKLGQILGFQMQNATLDSSL